MTANGCASDPPNPAPESPLCPPRRGRGPSQAPRQFCVGDPIPYRVSFSQCYRTLGLGRSRAHAMLKAGVFPVRELPRPGRAWHVFDGADLLAELNRRCRFFRGHVKKIAR